ncbi:LysR substrate-binding domain-containing protein [Salipiger sp. 1_MG-2023]|uniref:LysR substrate-binding domain-containing protein n=1 Tax=Salipiger sp. 1_MG-2023 TaxID=3062665 RepID=UPI0026E43A49|nr:LysR substrate-binding domain-containing protein [Salipiger sp. 1_MG-2023]MDO6585117.1 LysR substrate-binding domain-containing protein [Salipiger sp. 1_MG-2023]
MERLPPLRLLVTFEALSRHGSMRDAAARLNVTQPAVSQALRALEDHVGVGLIDRSVRPARLTEAGEMLARGVREGLARISSTLEDIRALNTSGERQVTVSCTLGMATYWLMPRLPSFYAAHPDITVNVQAPATDLPVLTPGIDVALRYGTGGWREGKTRKLFDELICPVGAPALVERLLAEGVGLSTAPLIHVRSPYNQHWAGWEDYFQATGTSRPRGGGQSFNNYVQAAQAVYDGRGLMLGWRSITGRAVQEGALRHWPEGTVDLGTAYYVTTAAVPSQDARVFVDWVCEETDTQ